MAEAAGERELIARAKAGDRRAFEALDLANRDQLATRLAPRLGEGVRSECSLEDVLQEIFLRALGLIARFEWRGEGSVLRWLLQIGEHLILNASQKALRAPLKLEVEPRASGVSPSHSVRRDERFQKLEKALEGLTPAERDAVLAVRIDGLSVDQAAKKLGKSPEAVKKAVTRALSRLRERLDDTESLHLPPRRIEKPPPERNRP